MVKKMKNIKILIVTLILLFSMSMASASTVTVARDGSGTYNCDGTNDEVQINQAISAAGVDGTVYLKSGTYVIGDTIRFSMRGTELTGDSNAIVKLKNNALWGAYKTMFNANGYDDLYVHGFEVDGNYANNDELVRGMYLYRMFQFVNCDNVVVEDMYLHENAMDFVYFESCSNGLVNNCEFFESGHENVWLNKCNNMDITNNRGDHWVNTAFRIELSHDVNILNNEIWGAGNAISGYGTVYIKGWVDYYPTYNILIKDNEFHNICDSAVYICGAIYDSKHITSSNSAKNIYVLNNVFYDVNHDGTSDLQGAISVSGFTNVVIENNVIFGVFQGGILSIYSPYPYHDDTNWDMKIYFNNNICKNTDTNYEMIKYYSIVNSPKHIVYADYNNWYGGMDATDGNSNIVWGTHNTNLDPEFVYPSYDSAKADFHLKSTYGSWNGNSWVISETISPLIDAGNPLSNFEYEPDNNGGRINIGAYGNTIEASKSGAGTTPTEPEAEAEAEAEAEVDAVVEANPEIVKVYDDLNDYVEENTPITNENVKEDDDNKFLALLFENILNMNSTAQTMYGMIIAGLLLIVYNENQNQGNKKKN
jgi:hypothetical protein